MTTLRWLLDVNAPNAARTFDQIGARMTELDRSLQRTREISIGDREAMAKLARLQAQAERFKDRIHGMPLTIEGAAKAEGQLLTLEATADRLNEKLAGGRRRPGIGGLLGSIPNPLGVGAASPQAVIGGLIAGLAALPFAAQAAAGAITVGLGGALTAIGVIGAAKTKQVQGAFHHLSVMANADLVKIGQPFIPVLQSVARTAGRVLGGLTGPLRSAMKIIAPDFKVFSDSLIRAFGQPAVVSAIQDVAKAFGAILKALAPQLGTDIKDVATGITRIANAVKQNPGAFAAIISFFFKATGFALSMVAALTSVANYIEKHFIPALMHIRNGFRDMFHWIAAQFDQWRHWWANAWDVLFRNTIGRVIRGGHDIEREFNTWRHNVAVIFDGVRHDIAAAWDAIWRNTIGRVQRGVSDVTGWFRRLPGMILRALFGLGHSLGSFAAAALNEMWSGFKRIGGGIVHWIEGFAHAVVGIFKKIWGIFSPSSVFADIGKNMMLGLEKGIRAHAHRAQGAVRGAMGPGSGALGGDAAANMRLARSMFPWPASMWPAFVSLEMREAGFNRFARNPSSGAYGIPQALPPTKMPFAAQAAGGSHAGPQLSWMFSYIAGRYGNPLAAWAHEQSAGWYGRGLVGGIFNRPTLIGVGESGPERVDVTPLSRPNMRAGGPLVTFGDVIVQDATDAEMIRQKVSYAITASGFGS